MYSDRIMNMCFVGCLLVSWAFPNSDTKRGERFKVFMVVCNFLFAIVVLGYNTVRVFYG